MEWKKYKLGEILIFNNGKSRPVNEGSYPLYGGNGIVDFVSDYLFEDNIIIGRVGANCGSIHNCDGKCWVSDNAISVNVKNGFDKRYVYYLLKMLDLNKKRIGAAQPLITQEIIAGLNVILPPIDEQYKIGELLSNLDRKIALNKRINHNLEAMAKQLYDYWFVQFDFPNAEGKPYKSSGGKMVWSQKFKREIPEGWEECKLADFLTIKNGRDHKHLQEGLYPVYGSGGEMRRASDYLYEGESVLMPRKGTLNNIMYVNEAFWTVDTMFYSVMDVPYCAKYVYYSIRDIDFTQWNAGTGVPSMTSSFLNSIPLIKPALSILKRFDGIISPWYAQIGLLTKETESLVKQRDALLPLLMNGQATVNSD